MKIKFNSIYLLFICLLPVFIACEEEEALSEDSNYMLHCIMNEGQTPQIKVGELLDVFPEYPFEVAYHEHVVSNCKIEVKQKSNGKIYAQVNELWKEVTAKPYSNIGIANNILHYYEIADFYPQAGETYDVSVSIYGWEEIVISTLSATTVIPSRVSFDAEQPVVEEFDGWEKCKCNMSLTDASDGADYYYFLPYILELSGDVNIDTVNTEMIWKNFEGCQYSDSVLSCYSFGYHGFEIEGLETDKNVRYGTDYQGILFDDKSFNGQVKDIAITYSSSSDSEYKTYLIVEVLHITESYYKYYDSILRQANTQLDIYSEPVQVYTNIKNGFGLFGGATISKQIIEITPD